MAIEVRWDDGTAGMWDNGDAVRTTSSAPRPAFEIIDADDTPLVVIPDFGVRYAGEAPDRWKDPKRAYRE